MNAESELMEMAEMWSGLIPPSFGLRIDACVVKETWSGSEWSSYKGVVRCLYSDGGFDWLLAGGSWGSEGEAWDDLLRVVSRPPEGPFPLAVPDFGRILVPASSAAELRIKLAAEGALP